MIFKGQMKKAIHEWWEWCKVRVIVRTFVIPKSIQVVLATEAKTSKPFKLRALLSWLVHASR